MRSKANPHPTLVWIALGLIVLLGAFLRFQGLGSQDFWFNEAASHYYAQGSPWEIVRYSFTVETNPPGLHLLIHCWEKVAGLSEWALRLPSALAGSLTLLVFYFFARFFLGRHGSLIATALLALSSLHVWYSQECRAFAIWVLWIVLAYLCFLRWLKTRQRVFLILNAFFLFLAVFFHYFGLHAILVENLYLLAFWRKERRALPCRPWILSQVVLLVLLIPLLIMMASVDRTHVAWWQESGVHFDTLKALLFHLNGVFFFLTPERWVKALLLLSNAVLLILGLRALWRKPPLLFLLLAVALPVILNLLYSLLVSPILGNAQSAGRYFLLTLPPYLVLLAAGWESLWRRFRRPLAFGSLLALYLLLQGWGIAAIGQNIHFQRDQNERLCRILFASVRPGDLLIASPWITVDYYADRLEADLSGVTVISTSRFEEHVLDRLPDRATRVWLYLDPAHHFDELIREVAQRYNLRPVLEERQNRLSGSGLVLLARE
ncbi:glycosyltransferase family 39 protein [bacterium]|nr:glycosyltransferase family 39 protein [bacterium]